MGCWPWLLAVLALAAHIGNSPQTQLWLFELWTTPPLLPETDELTRAIKAVPKRVLTEEERRIYERDGVVVLRNVVNDQELLQRLRDMIWPLAVEPDRESLHKAWSFNGAVRALVREELFPELAASAMGVLNTTYALKLEEAPIWGYTNGVEARSPLWHADDRLPFYRKRGGYHMVSIWLALTNAAQPLEFVKGSWRVRADIEATCTADTGGGVKDFKTYPHACVDEKFAPGLREKLGTEVYLNADMKPGDIFVFHGYTLHRSARHPGSRLAFSARYVGSAGRKKESDTYFHPRGLDRDRLPWWIMPVLQTNSPKLPAETKGRIGWVLGL